MSEPASTAWAPSAGGHRTLAERAFSALHDGIVSGDLAPGQRLRIDELAVALQVSHLPIREAIRQQFCDAVTIARPLIANNDLVQQFAAGMGRPARPCTYCNKCLVNAVENPLGCYDETRFDSREAMIAQIMSVFTPAPFV